MIPNCTQLYKPLTQLNETIHNFFKSLQTLQNPTQILHNYNNIYKTQTLQIFTQLHTTIHTLSYGTQLHKKLTKHTQIVHNSTILYKCLHNSTKPTKHYKTIQNYTQPYTTLHNSTKLDKNVTFQQTLQNLNTMHNFIAKNSTELVKTLQSFLQSLQISMIFTKALHNFKNNIF